MSRLSEALQRAGIVDEIAQELTDAVIRDQQDAELQRAEAAFDSRMAALQAADGYDYGDHDDEAHEAARDLCDARDQHIRVTDPDRYSEMRRGC